MKKLIAAFAGAAIMAPAALAAPSHFVKVTPSKVVAGKTVTVSGSVGKGCQIGHKGDVATVSSKAFAGATKEKFAGVPAVTVSLAKSKTGAFSVKVKLSKKLKKGSYSVAGRCGGGAFGRATLHVSK
jgi:type 1 fimbria pilin